MILVILTLVLAVGWYLAVSAGQESPVSSRLVLAGIGATGQIVLTCMVLGLVGWLTAGSVAATTLVIEGVLVGVALARAADDLGGVRAGTGAGSAHGTVSRSGGGGVSTGEVASGARAGDSAGSGPLAHSGGGWVQRLQEGLRGDLRSAAAAARAALGWETAILGALFLFAAAWLGTAAYFYPPRGVDDLVYHLPPIYQAVQDHRFEILPLALRKFFAFPFSAEMPFLWMAVLTRSVHWVGAAQALFGLLGIAATYALGRRFRVSPRGSAMAAALFGTMPVVLLQATSNYVDLVTNAWVLAGAAALLEYERAGRRLTLGVAALATGLVLGSKFQAIPFAFLLTIAAVILILRAESVRARRAASAAMFGGIVLATGGYWYLRNWARFSNPFYPLPIKLGGVELFPGDWPQASSIWSRLMTEPLELFRIPLRDPGLGTYNGGFGFLMWGFALPALVWAGWHAWREDGAARPGRLLVLALIPVGYAAWFISPFEDLNLTGRYVLAAGGLVFVAAAALLEAAAQRKIGAASALRGAAVLAAFLPLVNAAGARQPLLNLAPVANDPPQTRSLSSLRYLSYTLRDLAQMSRCWAPLDEMTKGGAGLSVYEAADFSVFWTAPTYGSELQNRIWEFEPDLDRDPEAYFFHTPRKKPLYLGKEIHRETVAADARYELVASEGDDATTLYVLRSALAERGRMARLATFYRLTDPTVLAQTAGTLALFEPGSVVIAPFPLAEAYFAHKADGGLRAELEPATTKEIPLVAARFPDKPVYTFGGKVSGRTARKVGELKIEERPVPIVRNEPLSAGANGTPAGGGDAR